MRPIVAYSVKAYVLANAWKRIALLSVKLAPASCKFSTAQTILPGQSCFQKKNVGTANYC